MNLERFHKVYKNIDNCGKIVKNLVIETSCTPIQLVPNDEDDIKNGCSLCNINLVDRFYKCRVRITIIIARILQ